MVRSLHLMVRSKSMLFHSCQATESHSEESITSPTQFFTKHVATKICIYLHEIQK